MRNKIADLLLRRRPPTEPTINPSPHDSQLSLERYRRQAARWYGHHEYATIPSESSLATDANNLENYPNLPESLRDQPWQLKEFFLLSDEEQRLVYGFIIGVLNDANKRVFMHFRGGEFIRTAKFPSDYGYIDAFYAVHPPELKREGSFELDRSKRTFIAEYFKKEIKSLADSLLPYEPTDVVNPRDPLKLMALCFLCHSDLPFEYQKTFRAAKECLRAEMKNNKKVVDVFKEALEKEGAAAVENAFSFLPGENQDFKFSKLAELSDLGDLPEVKMGGEDISKNPNYIYLHFLLQQSDSLELIFGKKFPDLKSLKPEDLTKFRQEFEAAANQLGKKKFEQVQKIFAEYRADFIADNFMATVEDFLRPNIQAVEADIQVPEQEAAEPTKLNVKELASKFDPTQPATNNDNWNYVELKSLSAQVDGDSILARMFAELSHNSLLKICVENLTGEKELAEWKSHASKDQSWLGGFVGKLNPNPASASNNSLQDKESVMDHLYNVIEKNLGAATPYLKAKFNDRTNPTRTNPKDKRSDLAALEKCAAVFLAYDDKEDLAGVLCESLGIEDSSLEVIYGHLKSSIRDLRNELGNEPSAITAATRGNETLVDEKSADKKRGTTVLV